AYFKTHYPGIFMAAVLKNGGGYYPPAVYAAEARRLGVKVIPPDLNLSDKYDGLKSGRIFLGLYRVRDITTRTVEQIEKARPFGSLGDFLGKIDISGRETENLIRVGFFDSIETSRPKLLWEYRLYGRRRPNDRSDLFASKMEMPLMKNMPALTAFSRYEIFKAEKEILEIPASFHPLTLFDTYKNPDIGHLFHDNEDREISLVGWLADRKRIKTRDGKWMVFLTLDSPEDTFEAVLFPEIYARYRETIYKYRYLHITGTINREGGNPALLAEKIFPHPTGLKERKYI
ncbi:MAG: OB-fold nucleic acid binding domain-containing protein, partial [Candidatus Zixiibacteriota bacterium]